MDGRRSHHEQSESPGNHDRRHLLNNSSDTVEGGRCQACRGAVEDMPERGLLVDHRLVLSASLSSDMSGVLYIWRFPCL